MTSEGRASGKSVIAVYGIKNCDTMKRARAWLDGHGVVHAFHDYKTAGIEKTRLENWVSQLGWEALLNRAGTTFRKLPDADKAGPDGKEGGRLDAGPALHDQAASPGKGRKDHRRLSARTV